MRILTFLLSLGLIQGVFAQEKAALDAETLKKIEKSLNAGADHLVKTQKEDGSWVGHPATAALGVMALHNVEGSDPEKTKAALEKALAYMMKYKQDDGSLYPADRHKADKGKSGFYPNYSTSISLLALATLNRPEHKELMIKMRNYLKDSQFTDKSKVDFGGIGYGKTGRADLSNGSWASEALAKTDYLDKEPYSKDPEADKKNEKMYEAMRGFLTRCQNLKKSNDAASFDDGGFFYRPNESKAPGSSGNMLISSGSMTYAGLKSMLHARMDRNDPRVKGAIKYLTGNFTVTENPGMGQMGLYYYIHVMTKALDAYGQDVLVDEKGNKHDWKKEVSTKVLADQKDDGSWVNSNGRFMEGVPVLSTSYMMIALKTATGKQN